MMLMYQFGDLTTILRITLPLDIHFSQLHIFHILVLPVMAA